jgi:hypothetical protein
MTEHYSNPADCLFLFRDPPQPKLVRTHVAQLLLGFGAWHFDSAFSH